MDKTRKKKLKQYIAWASLAVLVALLATMPLIAGKNAEAEGPVAVIESGTVDAGTISVKLGGGGLLREESSESVTLPEGIKLKEFLVENGAAVQEGDPLAVVDRVSVMSVIAEIQQTMDYLANQIEEAEDGEESTRLTAITAGRVKKIYARPGDNVQDVMLEHGALAVLSLDGRMAVDVEKSSELSAGDSVEVILPDAAVISGRVESSLGGTLTVTVADKGYASGEKVTVRHPGGEVLGTGELYIHNAWNVTAYFGKVAQVNVKENDRVSKGRLLFRLEETGHSTQAQLLNAERQEYESLMEKLFRIYETGYLTAPCDGCVYGVESDSTWLLSAEETGGETGWQVILLSDVTPGDTPENPPQDPSEGGEEPAPAKTYRVISAVQVDAAVSGDVWSVRRKDINAVVTDLSVLNVSIPKTTPAENLAIAGVQTPAGQPHAVQPGDILLYVEEGGSTYWLYHSKGNMGGFGDFGNIGGFFFGGNTQTETFEKFDLTENTVLTVTPGNTMTLDITIDELDIGKVFLGQEAEVTIHALGGEKVRGVITGIGAATNSGGNSKFSVTVTITRERNMLAGMSASASMTLGSVENALRIPVAALNGNGSRTFVYTGYDEETGVPVNPVPVTTGVSDGEYVQILSGLEEGDTFWYSYYDARESSAL